ncbi:hypothetical protein [Myxacorys almedinensis]|uniref:Uncharacterized protein n=1 Tax=Myxacorys almedinensis A TaxID=2690445 RepID=A0A8J7Z275_9CYAN|nr:hypothetical protein [Myxacorys almedinensis]NDJ16793.1 hypothetical protein [Myxacorys almedinensis A]
MTDQSSNNLPDRVERLEVDMTDVKISLNRLIDAFYQNNAITTNAVERLAEAQLQYMERNEVRMARIDDRFDQVLNRIDEMQSEVRGLQTENRRIWQVISDRLGLE